MYADLDIDIPTVTQDKVSSQNMLFSWPRILLYAGLFGVAVLGLQRLLRHTCENWVAFDCPYYWPVSIFEVRNPGIAGLLTAAVVIAGFFAFYRVLESRGFNVRLTVVFAALLILGSSLTQGVDVGLRTPEAGDVRSGVLAPVSQDGQEYWHDAIQIADPVYFLGHYNEIQPTLHEHAHTHPPGAVLTYYFLSQIFADPAFISIAIMLFSVTVTVVFFYRLVATETSEGTAKYMAFLIALLPAVEVYYLATIDAVITSLLVAALYLFCFGKRRWAVPAAAAILATAFLLTYVSVFILPVLLGCELIMRRSVRRFAVVLAAVVGVHAVLYFASGYNGWAAFREASHYENPNGLILFVDPVNYLFTRVEDVSEILFFFGPFLIVLFWRGMKRIELTPLFTLNVLAIATLLGMFLIGAWRTGETARACAFIYPFLLFPVAKLIDGGSTKNARLQLASLVFLQTIVMQSLGTFHW
jgi:hypothetical protein